MIKRLFIFLLLGFLSVGFSAQAEDGMNVLKKQWKPNETQAIIQKNPFLKQLLENGVELIPIGQEQGFDGWVTTKDGQVQIFYTVPGKDAVLNGTLIGPNGENLTALQIARYEAISGNNLVEKIDRAALRRQLEARPGEILLGELSQSTWFGYGDPNSGLPHIYVYLTTGCGECYDYFNQLLSDYVQAGLLEVRVVLSYTNDQEKQTAARILSDETPARLFLQMAVTKDTVLDGTAAQQGVDAVEANREIIQRHNMANNYPVTFYKSGAGEPKIVVGAPQDVHAMVFDVTVEVE